MAEAEIMSEKVLRRNFIQAVLFCTAWIAISTYFHWGIAAQVVGPLLGMLRYWQVYGVSDTSGHLDSMFADSLYYLGFILTVASLMASLLPYMMTDADPTPEQLLGQFGVALSTTLAGILGRTYHSAFRINTDQLEHKAILGVRERASQLQMELEKAGEEFAKFNDRMVSNYERLGETLEDDVASFYEASLKRIEDMVGQTNARLEESLRDSSKIMEASMRKASQILEETMRSSAEDLEESLHRTVSSVDGAVQQLADRLGELKLDPSAVQDAVVRSFSGITGELETISVTVREAERVISDGLVRMRAVVEDAGGMEKEIKALRSAGEGLHHVGSELGDLTAKFNDFRQSLAGATQGGEMFGRAMMEQAQGLERFHDMSADLGVSMEGYIAGIHKIVSEMEEQGDGFAAVRNRLQGEMDGLEQQARGFYSDLRDAVEGYSLALQDMGGLIAQTLEDTRVKRSTQ